MHRPTSDRLSRTWRIMTTSGRAISLPQNRGAYNCPALQITSVTAGHKSDVWRGWLLCQVCPVRVDSVLDNGRCYRGHHQGDGNSADILPLNPPFRRRRGSLRTSYTTDEKTVLHCAVLLQSACNLHSIDDNKIISSKSLTAADFLTDVIRQLECGCLKTIIIYSRWYGNLSPHSATNALRK